MKFLFGVACGFIAFPVAWTAIKIGAIMLSTNFSGATWDNVQWKWGLMKQKYAEYKKMKNFMNEVKWVI